MTTAIIPIRHVHRGDKVTLNGTPCTIASNHRINPTINRVGVHVGSELRIIDIQPDTVVTLTGYQELT